MACHHCLLYKMIYQYKATLYNDFGLAVIVIVSYLYCAIIKDVGREWFKVQLRKS